jgi:formate--tetrahydrofolate ligase
MKTDLDIARAVQMQDIGDIAAKLGLEEHHLYRYGRHKAKIPLSLIDPAKIARGKLILVTALSPTPAGEGKTTTCIGLSDAMRRLGANTTVVLREPSLGPVFGIKGGATGGGHSQVVPMEDINLHFTGDFAAVEKAHNLLAAIVDNNLQNKKNTLGIDPRTVVWKRVMDMNDRSLRQIVTGLGGTGSGVPRESGFDITAASEVMAILCLSESLEDLKSRLGNIFIGFTYDKQPIFARDLKVNGAMAALLKDALQPNLVQTLEGGPAILHGGPFANIAQGTNSVIATRMGLSLSDYVVTEAGFGADLGAEKFFDIKCQAAGLSPSAVVVVATIRALKYHGGTSLKALGAPDPGAVALGLPNLEKHLENMALFGLPVAVAINQFPTDSPEEIQVVEAHCKKSGIAVFACDNWARGGAGALGLAEEVLKLAQKPETHFTPLYDWNQPVTEKIHAIATRIYGADGVEYAPKAKADLRTIEKLGLDKLAVCIAKTQKSLSDNPDLTGRPRGFNITVRSIEIAAGAGFIVPLTGEMMRMPGLPEVPAAEGIDVDSEGNISGLF